jgi:hypothetical protein
MFFLPYYAYVFSSTKLERKAKQVLPGSDGWGGVEHGGRGLHGEMTQTIYVPVNK